MANEELVVAIRQRDRKGLTDLLRSDPALAKSGRTVVGVAQAAWLQGLSILKQQGADLNAPYRGYRALHALIQEEGHPEDAGESGTEGVEAGLDGERVKCLEWLLANGADPELQGAWPPARALIIAAFGGIEPFVDTLWKGGAARNLFTAAAVGDTKTVRGVLQADAFQANARDAGNGITPLACAAGSRLWKHGAKNRKALLEVATLLLDARADPNARTKSYAGSVDAITLAVGSRNQDILRLLLHRGGAPERVLMPALWRDDRELAQLAFDHGADSDKAFEGDRPVLNELIRWGRLEAAMWLLSKGANPNLTDSRGWTAVHQAVSRGSERMVAALLASSGDPNAKNAEGVTPAQMAKKGRRAPLAGLFS